ncbi:hypothetical protein H4R33_006269 [Dimargaris cristalligena]|uniref:Glyoxylate reductase n=1 Tax=Dimargaris cristalligena TaxID=215637 RepID=A0A4Q0A1C7_9FUNG|nr:hypothetical protein H4R33_006269 [Dimargaris cristalligena]RKP39883.1 Glyoxylate reductase [Dimargaris cristalligena]|eukprot:RKP39883.1 Glyoxylate reductase [Dimargaris cristalligena]
MAAQPRKRIFVTQRLTDNTQKRLESLTQYDVDQWETGPLSHEELLKCVKGVHGIFCLSSNEINKEVMEAAGDSLKVISTMSVGHNHIDLVEAKKRGIVVGYTPDVLTDAVADLAMALVLMVSRRLVEAVETAKTGGWITMQPNFLLGHQLTGKTAGIIGLGRIGEGLATRLRAFGVKKILYNGRRPKPDVALRAHANYVDLDVLLRESDVVALCCSLNDSTFHLFDYSAFRQMKPSAIIVNVARGEVIKQEDLVAALSNGIIAGAGLDVVTPEPLPVDHPLYKFKNCIVLPHIASATVETRDAMGNLAIDHVVAGIEGQPLQYALDI